MAPLFMALSAIKALGKRSPDVIPELEELGNVDEPGEGQRGHQVPAEKKEERKHFPLISVISRG